MLSTKLIENWSPDAAVSNWARTRGFGDWTPLTESGLRRLSMENGGRPTGLYLWEGVDHSIYIGISNDSVAKRLRTHTKNFPQENIQGFYYRPDAGDAQTLREIERDLIHEAINDGFACCNTEHSSAIYGDSDFDNLISVSRQETWFRDPAGENLKSDGDVHQLNKSEQARSNKKYSVFAVREDARQIIDAVSVYLRCCVPYPYESQIQYWGLSCLPSTPGRIATVNMSMLEMLWFYEDQGRTIIRIGTDYRFLPPFATKVRLRRLGAAMTPESHRSGGPYEQILEFADIESFIRAMQKSKHLRAAAARFALDRIRRSRLSGRYRDAHNLLMAQAALDRMNSWEIAHTGLGDLHDR